MSAFIALLLKMLPLLAPLWPIIQAILNHETAASAGNVGASQEYLTYVVGQGAGGGLAAFGAAKGIESWGLSILKNGMIGYRLRTAAQLGDDSSEREIEKACEKLK